MWGHVVYMTRNSFGPMKAKDINAFTELGPLDHSQLISSEVVILTYIDSQSY